jgi:hypothetical protein
VIIPSQFGNDFDFLITIWSLFVTIKLNKMSITKKCSTCGNEFTAQNDKGTYCSDKCRAKAYRTREKRFINTVTVTNFNVPDERIDLLAKKVKEFEEQLGILISEYKIMVPYIVESAKTSAVFPLMEERYSKLSGQIDNVENATEKMERLLREKIEKNSDNIQTVALNLKGVIDKVNFIIEGGNEDKFGKLLQNEKLIDIVSEIFSGKANRKN